MPDAGAVDAQLAERGDDLKVLGVQVDESSRVNGHDENTEPVHSHLLPALERNTGLDQSGVGHSEHPEKDAVFFFFKHFYLYRNCLRPRSVLPQASVTVILEALLGNTIYTVIIGIYRLVFISRCVSHEYNSSRDTKSMSS